MSDGLHQELRRRICINLAELNRQLDRHDLNQALQQAETIHEHENQEQHQRGQFTHLQMLEEQIMNCTIMIGELMATRQPFIKFIHDDKPTWLNRADIIRACVTPNRTFTLWLRETNDGGYSHGLDFALDDPQVARIMAFLDNFALDLNAGNTQPL